MSVQVPTGRHGRWFSRTMRWGGTVTAAALALSVLTTPASSAAAAAGPGPASAATKTAPPDLLNRQLSAELGSGWWRGTDLAIASSGDSSGMHYFVARESDGYYWRPLASILPGGLDAGSWMGYSCVSGDDRYILATMAPTMADTQPAMEDRGAFAYVIDIATGRVRPLVAGVAMYYDTAGCGVGDTGVLASFPGTGEARTTLITVNLKTASIARRQTLRGQFTSAIPTGSGITAYTSGAIASVSRSGRVRDLASVPGTAYDLAASAGGGLDYLTTTFDAQAQAWHLPPGRPVRPAELATGERTSLNLFPGSEGRNVVLGATVNMHSARPGATRIYATRVAGTFAMSRQGKVAEAYPATRRGAGQTLAPDLVAIDSGSRLARPLPAAAPSSLALPSTLGGAAPTRASPPAPAAGAGKPACAVPRLDPRRQVLQPNAHQVEWAVDEAVRGDLLVHRPSDFDNMGLPAYSPQKDIPRPALVGGGSIPPQVLLGVLAVESNFDQASFHALPGYAGDPLIADYYGAGGGINTIDYKKADCGYGIGQVTTGMTAGSKYWGSSSTQAEAMQAKIAVDYTENISASVKLLSLAWNQLASYHPAILANGGNSSYVENWYMAIWAYNTGLDPNAQTGNTSGCTPGPHCTDGAGHWGLGWTNNPLDPDWKPNRTPFLLDSYADAAHPGDWPYQEKVLGWAAVPLRDYRGDISYTPVAHYPTIAPFATFCTGADSCRPHGKPICGLSDFHCWWHIPVSWTNCAQADKCQHGISVYTTSAKEPGGSDPYPPDCNSALPASAYIVDDEPVDYNLVGCKNVNWKSRGTFKLIQGTNSSGVPISVIDTHQVGAGFGGQLFFAHNYAASDREHRVTGVWKIPLPRRAYHVLVHIPSTGGTTRSADYNVTTSNGKVYHFVVDQYQQQNQWVGIGYYSLGSNAQVTLDNVTDDGARGVHDVAFNAVAFVPVSGKAVNHSFDAVSLFDWNTNLNTNLPTIVDTPVRTMKTLHDWAVGYGYKGPTWDKPSQTMHGVSSYPKCPTLKQVKPACVPSGVWQVARTWADDAKKAGSAPSKSKKPVMTEPEWLDFANPTPGPRRLTSSTYSNDTSYKIKTHISLSYIVKDGRILPGSDQVNTTVRTGTTSIPPFVLGFMKAIKADYGIAPPNLRYDEVDANTFSGDATPVNPYLKGLAPGRQYVWHADPAKITSKGTCVAAHTITGGVIGWRPLAAQTPVAASVTAWVDALQHDKKVNGAVTAMAETLNAFFFSQATLGGSLLLHGPPIWQDTHIWVCANGKIVAGGQNGDTDDKPEINLEYQSYMPDLYLYFDNKLINESGRPATGPSQKGDFRDFSNIPDVTSVGGNPFGTCVSDQNGNGGNPWGLSVTDAPNIVPRTGLFCDSLEPFGNPYPGG